MIRLLRGTVVWRDNTYILIDVHDVGYQVYASKDVHAKIRNIGDSITVYTYLHVREDLLELYGFATREDLHLFEQLISVSGIGPKTAIGIFSLGTRGKIVEAIFSSDVSFFSQVPRLGKKNAQKLIIELKGKVGALEEGQGFVNTLSVDDEVVSALKTFGFSPREIASALRSIEDANLDVPAKIKLALKHLGK